MPALIESTDNLIYVSNISNGRFVPWHGMGIRLEEAPTSRDALVASGLDWKVEQKEVFVNGVVAEGYKANVRDRDNSILGIVSDRYKVVNNEDAFAFVDNLVDGSATKYETAGSLRNGKTVWMLAKMPDEKILGDDIAQYLCFTNTHDGTGSVKVVPTNIRVVCANTLQIAVNGAKRVWRVTHAGNLESKLFQAHETLKLNHEYFSALSRDAYRYANTSVTDSEFLTRINNLLPITIEMSDKQKQNVQKIKDNIERCFNMPDISKFKNSEWGVINALSDHVTHFAGIRASASFKETRFDNILSGRTLLDQYMKDNQLLKKIA